MDIRKTIGLIVALALISACSPKVTSTLQKSYQPISYDQEVFVLGLNEEVPSQAEVIGSIKVGDNGLSTNCDFETVVELAKIEVRKAGGNVLKITEHKLPSVMGSSCHQIKADILRMSDTSQIQKEIISAQEVIVDPNIDYATLNIYRFSGAGALVAYDVYLGDSVVCRVKNKSKQTIQINKNKLGYNSLWAKTESKDEIPVNLEAGHQYYVRCGLKMGIMVGRPSLELVDAKTGKMEFESIKTKK